MASLTHCIQLIENVCAHPVIPVNLFPKKNRKEQRIDEIAQNWQRFGELEQEKPPFKPMQEQQVAK